MSLWGCGHPYDRGALRSLAERLDHIELVTLEAEYPSPPVGVEEEEQEMDRGIGTRGPPEDAIGLTIEEVRKAALAGNLDLKVELIAPTLAGTVIDEEEARFEATFFASASRQKSDPPTDAPDDTLADLVSTDHELGIRLPLETGGSIRVSVPLITENERAPGVASSYETDVQLSIHQPLLRNAGVAVNTAPIITARLAQGQARSRTKLAAIRILTEAEIAYWDHFAAGGVLLIRREQYKLATEQRDQAQRLADAAVVPRIEVVRSEAGVARRREAIIVAETRRRKTERDLKRIMNAPDLALDSPTVLMPRTEPRPVHLTLDAAALAEMAVLNRMEMVELELQLMIDAVTIDVAQNDTLPSLSLDYTYSFRGVGGNLDRSLDSLLGNRFSDWSLGVVLEVPLGNQAAKARLRRAFLQRTVSQSIREQLRLDIQQEVHDAVDNLEENWQRIRTAQREKQLAAEVYRAEQRQFQAGTRTSTEVLEAVAFLAIAQIREVRALTGYEIARIEIALATGTLLGQGRVRLTPYALENE